MEKDKGWLNIPPQQKRDFSLEKSPIVPVPSEGHIQDFEKLAEVQRQYADSQRPAGPSGGSQSQPETSNAGQNTPESPKREIPISDSELFGLDASRQELLIDLMGPEQEKAAEKEATPLDMDDLFKFKEFRQTIKVTGNIKATFRTMTSDENLQIYRMLMEKAEVSAAYLNEYTSMLALTCSLKNLAGTDLPNHLKDGKFDQAAFDTKLRAVLHLPNQVNAVLSVHCMWFDKRVRKLFLREQGESGAERNIKNG